MSGKHLKSLAGLLTTLSLSFSSTLSAELLSLEEHGATQIMAKIRATMSAKAASSGTLIPWEFSYRSEGADKLVQVQAPLPLTIKMNGGDTDISLYKVKVNNTDAVLTMSSREEVEAGESVMLMSYSMQEGERGARYQVNIGESLAQENEILPERPKPAGDQNPSFDIELQTPEELLPKANTINGISASSGRQPLTIYVFKHKDVREKVSKLTHQHFSWWARHMNSINDDYRNEHNLPLFSELVVDFRTDKTIQSFKYKGDSSERLKSLATEFRRYQTEQGLFGDYRFNKFLLMTEKMLNWKTLGVAYIGGQYGIASDDDDQVAAHEIGHMLNGIHDKAKVIYTGWWCESILYWQHLFLRASCHKYTDANKQAITDYLK